jgi:chromate reductase
MKKIIVLIGGISSGSLNRRFFETVAALDEGSAFEFNVFDIASLPFYSQDLEGALPASVAVFKEAALAADGVLIVTPEYNRSIPGVLKNALDWGSRLSSERADGNIWTGKPTAIMGASPGAIGTFGAQQHLRNICSWLDMPTMNQPTVYFNASTGMADAAGEPSADSNDLTASAAVYLGKFLAAFEAWVTLFVGHY